MNELMRQDLTKCVLLLVSLTGVERVGDHLFFLRMVQCLIL